MPVSSRLARKVPSIRPTVGKFWMPEKPRSISARRNCVGDHERVGAVDAGQHRRVLHHRQHLVRHLADDLVGVAVGQQAGERAAPGHAVAARVVDHDQVDAAGLLALGRQAGAGAAADDRLAARDLARGGGRGCRGGRCGAWCVLVVSVRRARAPAARRGDLAPGGDQRVGEGLVVDVQRQAQQLAVGAGAEAAARSRRTARGRPRGRGTAGPAGRSPRRRLRGSGSAPARASRSAWRR